MKVVEAVLRGGVASFPLTVCVLDCRIAFIAEKRITALRGAPRGSTCDQRSSQRGTQFRIPPWTMYVYILLVPWLRKT